MTSAQTKAQNPLRCLKTPFAEAVSAPEIRGFFASIGSFNGRVCEEYKTRKGNNSACLRQVTSTWPPTAFVGLTLIRSKK